MMRVSMGVVVLAGVLRAQYAPVPGTGYPALEAILNAKPAMTKAAGAPAGSCTQALDLYLNTTNGDAYICSATNVWLKVAPGIATTMSTGASDPVAACAAPSASGLVLYTQTTTQDIFACVAANTWKRVLSTTNTGTYVATGGTGTAPANPATGNVTCYYSSVSLTQICLDASGNVFSAVKTAASRTANQFVTHVPATGIPATAAIVAADLPAAVLIRTCEVVIGDPGAASAVLANDNDTPTVCANDTTATMTITAVHCYAPAGSPTVTPIITGGSATSILSGALTCSSATGGAAGSLNGTPTETAGQTIDANITTAGGTAKYIVIRITRAL